MANLPELQARLQSVSPLWYPIGMELQIGLEILRKIPLLAQGDDTLGLDMVLMKWLRMKDPPPTLEALVRALSSKMIDAKPLAESLLQDKDKV